MMRYPSRSSWLAAWILPALLAVPLAAGERQATAQAPVHSITWADRQEAVEQWLREAPVERTEQIPIGVTKPSRIFFGGDGPARSAAWKPLMPGIYKGFWESYKSEIAAYELDKMLGLDMVPPSVERTIRGSRGAVVMWVEGVKAWDTKKPGRRPDPVAWTREVVRMKMFDQLDRQHRPQRRQPPLRRRLPHRPHRSLARVHRDDGSSAGCPPRRGSTGRSGRRWRR
jgi:hypothetical protein